MTAAADDFFPLPNQDLEGELRRLVSRVEALSLDRHRIAHGLVDRVNFGAADGSIVTGFALVVPWYGESRLQFTQNDAWPSAKIEAVLERFDELGPSILALTNALLAAYRSH